MRTIHYVSPSVWAWRRERLKTIGRSVDRMLALFPFEPPLYEAEGIPVTYVGHPMAADAATHGTRRETRELLKLKPATPVFALLPGSRLSEVEMHGELILDAAARIFEARDDAQFLVPFATRATRDAFENTMHRTGHDGLPLTLLYGHAEDALRAADVGIVASGTATLEAALARCPHIIYYRVSALTARMVLRRLLLPYVGLPNVLAGRFVVPEFIQDNATPVNLAQAALNLFDDTVTRRRLEALFAGFAHTLSADTRATRRGRGGGRTRAGGRGVLIAGIDEAGRGPLAGPVYAAAVILDPARPIKGLRDSKVLTAAAREDLAGHDPPALGGVGDRVGRRGGDRYAQHPAGDAAGDAPRGRGARRWCRPKRWSTATSVRGSRARCTRS